MTLSRDVVRLHALTDRFLAPDAEGSIGASAVRASEYVHELFDLLYHVVVDGLRDDETRLENLEILILGDGSDVVTEATIHTAWRKYTLAAATLKCCLMSAGNMDYYGVFSDFDLGRRWRQIRATIQHMFTLARSLWNIQTLTNDDVMSQEPEAMTADSEFSWMRNDLLMDTTTLNNRQRLILYILQKTSETMGGLRRHGNCLYRQKWIRKMKPVLTRGGLPACSLCGLSEAEHPWEVRRRKTHVFTPSYAVDEACTARASTSAWVPVGSPDEDARGDSTDPGSPSFYPDSTIRTFIKLQCNKDVCLQAWQDLTKGGSDEEITVKYLLSSLDNELPLLEYDASRFAFINGIYNTKDDSFTPYFTESGTPMSSHCTQSCYIFFPHWMDWEGIQRDTSGTTSGCVDANMEPNLFCRNCMQPTNRHMSARCKDVDPFLPDGVPSTRPRERSWLSIQTPITQSIFDYQRFGNGEGSGAAQEQAAAFTDVCTWIYALLGRVIFPLNTRDRWQVCMWIIGEAGTGKSTIAEVMKLFFQTSDVGIIQANMDPKFGMESYLNMMTQERGEFKRLLVCSEVKDGFGMPQSIFQQLVTGEGVSVQRKGKTNIVVEQPRCNLLMFGNEAPGYKENCGQFSRRTVEITFGEMVADGHKDGMLLDRIRNREIGRLLVKCCLAYKEVASKFGSYAVWGVDPYRDGAKILPPYFHRARERVEMETNSVKSFLQSDLVELGEDFRTPLREVKDKWKEHCANANVSTFNITFNERLYRSAFKKADLRVAGDPQNGGKKTVFGLRVRGEDENVLEGVRARSDAMVDPQNTDNNWVDCFQHIANATTEPMDGTMLLLLVKRLIVERGGSFTSDQWNHLTTVMAGMAHPITAKTLVHD